ncbi:MAG TPA: protein kinase [Terriglobales bacterium]|nr:protein kinase [Terriglobales bacterium]
MALVAGKKLGPYEILESIGAGGMGEVYRARDTRLQRTVAIKILPQALSSDQDRLERFQQEARILSALNHPNLMAIYDVGAQDGIHFLVSEFLDGQSLRDVISNGPLPQRKVTDYGLQIAKGLAAAHEKGIIHRDLKPENVFVLRDGRVKILDFGLAKQALAAAMADNATQTSPLQTAAGTVLGTAAYMSPEQVRGEIVDHRSDIFSLGVILYEMIAGQRAFKGDSAVEVMNAVLKQEPPELVESGLHVSVGLQKIVHRCLEKKPEARFQSASDLAFALDSLSAASGMASAPASALKEAAGRTQKDSKKRWSKLLIPVLVVAVLVNAAAAIWLSMRHPAGSDISFTQISFRSEYIRNARLSPDGRTVVFGAVSGGKPMALYSTRTDTTEAQPLGINANVLAISSQGEMAVKLHPRFEPLWTPSGTLARVPLGGGATRELLEHVLDADWNGDGSALAVSHLVGSRCRLEYPIGTVLYENGGYISDVRLSPAGDKIAFIDHPIFGDDRGSIEVMDLKGNRKVLAGEFATAQGLAWSPRGDEVWFTTAVAAEMPALRAVDLSGHQRVLVASPVRLHLQDVGKDGTVLLSSEDLRWQDFFVEKASGQSRDITSFPYQDVYAISRDGKAVLINAFVTGSSSSYDLYIQQADGSPPVKVGVGAALAFSFDGKWVAGLDPANVEHLNIIPTGVGVARTVNAPPGLHYLGATWMPDGKQMLITAAAQGRAPATYLQDLETGAARQITKEGTYVVPRSNVPMGVSPDGKYCVVTDPEGKRWIQPLDGSAPKELHGLLEGDIVVEWHGDSENVFVTHPEGAEADIYTVNVATGERKLWTHYSPSDKTAVIASNTVMITPDGAHYAYGVSRVYSSLFVAKGIR